MAISNIFNKEHVGRIVSNIPVSIKLDTDYIFDVYEMANEAIEMLVKENRQIEVKEVNQYELLLYCIGEYFYSVSHLN